MGIRFIFDKRLQLIEVCNRVLVGFTSFALIARLSFGVSLMRQFTSLWIGIILLPLVTGAHAAETVTVSPHQSEHWKITATKTASGRYVQEPSPQILGQGSLRLDTGNGDGKDKGGKIWVGTSDFDGIKLSDLTRLTFSTFVVTSATEDIAPYLNIHLDTNDNGKWDGRFGGDDILSFDPAQQPPPKGNLKIKRGTWNTGVGGSTTHDASPAVGGWWIVGKENIAGRGSNSKTLQQIIEVLGDHAIVANTMDNAPGISVIAGAASGGTFKDFTGYLDQLTIGVKGKETIYNFEVDGAPAIPATESAPTNIASHPTPTVTSASTPPSADSEADTLKSSALGMGISLAVVLVVGVVVLASMKKGKHA